MGALFARETQKAKLVDCMEDIGIVGGSIECT